MQVKYSSEDGGFNRQSDSASSSSLTDFIGYKLDGDVAATFVQVSGNIGVARS